MPVFRQKAGGPANSAKRKPLIMRQYIRETMLDPFGSPRSAPFRIAFSDVRSACLSRIFSRNGELHTCFPQRHRIAEIAAVVERGMPAMRLQNALQAGNMKAYLPQRHRIAEIAAVVERGMPAMRLQNALQAGGIKAYLPQRHRIAEIAAVVERRGALRGHHSPLRRSPLICLE